MICDIVYISNCPSPLVSDIVFLCFSFWCGVYFPFFDTVFISFFCVLHCLYLPLSFTWYMYLFSCSIFALYLSPLVTGDRDRDLDRESRESIFRIRDRRRLDTTLRDETLKSLERDKVDSSLEGENLKKQVLPSQTPVNFGDDVHFMTEKVCVTGFILLLYFSVFLFVQESPYLTFLSLCTGWYSLDLHPHSCHAL